MINKNLEDLLKLHPAFLKLKNYLHNIDENTPEGKYAVDGDNIFVIISRYKTRPEAEIIMESHRRHSEIHLTLKGAEYLAYCPAANLERHTPYSEADDIEFWRKPSSYEKAFIGGARAVFFDCGEPHAPRIHPQGAPEDIIKAVVKFKKEIIEKL